MAMINRKTEVEPIDGTPVKRMFWSIISDYNLETAICELVDNAIDSWMLDNRKKTLSVSISLEVDRQLISVRDNAGGVKREDLRLLVAPGGSRNDPSGEIIGIFGVGSKRAGIALAEHLVIKTRFHDGETFELDITPEWLESDDWQLPAYAIPDIEPYSTWADMSHLRRPLSQEDVETLATHLGETYGWFIEQGCHLDLNGVPVLPRKFDTWAFPPGFPPRETSFGVDMGQFGKLSASITAGLIGDRVPDQDNYGVYFYCNHRLIAKEVRVRDVGYFVTAEAGVPHPDASLCRAIVRLQGPAQTMPWNSTKSGINFGHVAFQRVRPVLITLVSHFSSLSRRLKDDWEHKVFQYDSGEIERVDPQEVETSGRIILPRLPRVNKSRGEKYKAINRTQIRDKPWTLGLIETMSAVDVLSRQRLETKNRISLILLDSNFEIALKEFIVHRLDLFPQSQYNDDAIRRLFASRREVINAVSQRVKIPEIFIETASHYHGLRNKLTHERATVDVTDSDVANYRSTIERLLGILFDMKFSE
jgi:Histidine kinase-, DNA gyrase B-, and HSP90-like ATPase